MKTAIKITAVAVIAILAVLACSEDVGLTARNYSERNESKKAEYTNSPGTSPSISASLFYSSATVAEAAKEIRISFPANADILKASNADMTAKLKEFLNFYFYTNPATAPTVYTPSTLGNALNYNFNRRDGNAIIIRLESIPDIDYIVAKVDASKYKVFGQVLDFNGDEVGGESYDDLYTRISISYSTIHIMDASHTNLFYRPEVTCNFTIGTISGGSFSTSATTQYITLLDGVTSGPDSAYMRKILGDLQSKFEVQKYDQTAKTWITEGPATLYDSTKPAPGTSSFTTDLLYVEFKPEDLGIYRIKAAGLANLASADNYGDKPLKISINGSFLNNTIYSDPVAYWNENVHQWETANPVESITVKTDSSKKNVVLELHFDSIWDTVPIVSKEEWLKEIDTAEFNKSVKLVYNKDDSSSIIDGGTDLSSTPVGEFVELKITDVKYEAYKQDDPTNTNTNCIIITLDPSYQLKGNRSISLLLSPGFKYGGSITFGATSNVGATYYNGTFFWRSYGQLSGLGL